MFRGGRAAVLSLYAAKIEATRRSLPARDVAAAVVALAEERRAALQALADRRQDTRRALRESRAAERFSAKLARKAGRAAPEARPS